MAAKESSKRPTKLVIFDVDGTLVDSEAFIVETQRRTFFAHGLTPPSAAQGLSLIGLSLPEWVARLAGPDAPVDAMVGTYRRFMGTLRNDPQYREVLYPGIGALLARLAARRDIALGLATGHQMASLGELVSIFGWHGLFRTVQTPDTAPSKPDPGMILNAMRVTGAAPADTVMIGDSTFDMVMARDAGVSAIGVSWGYNPPDVLYAAGAERVVDSAEALRFLLEARFPPAGEGG
ncbi:HAD hydrolase-like protein [Emcibacter sp. SYSU 3D8]|uniref:HAD hydrolase-like protein n=1 Tax=Emcibacter sp. SYSU 3D8 TaxID=3133969 RepID=UPI0031FF0F55